MIGAHRSWNELEAILKTAEGKVVGIVAEPSDILLLCSYGADRNHPQSLPTILRSMYGNGAVIEHVGPRSFPFDAEMSVYALEANGEVSVSEVPILRSNGTFSVTYGKLRLLPFLLACTFENNEAFVARIRATAPVEELAVTAVPASDFEPQRVNGEIRSPTCDPHHPAFVKWKKDGDKEVKLYRLNARQNAIGIMRRDSTLVEQIHAGYLRTIAD